MKKNKSLILILLIFSALLLILPACGSSAANLNNQGNRDFEAKNYDLAMNNYDLSKTENPDLIEPLYNSGNTLNRQGNLEGATAQLKHSFQTTKGQEGETEQKLAQNSAYNLGNTYFEAKDWPAAIEAYKQALLINPDDMDAKYNLELALKQLEQQQPPPPPQQGQGQQQPQEPQQGQGGEQPDPQGQGGQGDQQQPSPPPPQGQGKQQPSPSELTKQEAKQLLDALGQDSQTLQERLQQQYGPQGPSTSQQGQDW